MLQPANESVKMKHRSAAQLHKITLNGSQNVQLCIIQSTVNSENQYTFTQNNVPSEHCNEQILTVYRKIVEINLLIEMTDVKKHFTYM